MKTTSALFFLSLIALLLSCSEPQNRFIDIEKTNSKILELSGIDILAFQQQVERDFQIYDAFYDSLLIELRVEGTNELFQKYGPYSIRTNGDTITSADRDSMIVHFTQGFAHGIIQEECSDTDSLCITKMKYRGKLNRIQLPYGRLDSETSEFIYLDLYKKEYLTKEEFTFMTLWWHILASAQVISDQEWYEARQKASN
jgi:hypothetical protein